MINVLLAVRGRRAKQMRSSKGFCDFTTIDWQEKTRYSDRGSDAQPASSMRSFGGAATSGRASNTSAAFAKIFHSFQQLVRVATQPTTQHPHYIDIQGNFAPKHSLRDGVNACCALSPVSMTFLVTVACRTIICRLDASPAASGPHDFALHQILFVRTKNRALNTFSVHRIPRPTFRDDWP